ncbi:ATP-binding cassette domain-containing protein [Vibrio sp. MMH1-50]|uniref:ATP-binding cassette domain-containing protein n=1 Tax=Vibrio sp. MMH1-50 TaxID=2917764 RepID=UPI001EF1EDE0|nr:ATP-binding cassette domain-containing protein [Vibrio sp. MMH1-50]MCG7514104.1 ATP-binding cassette domain-containing protein [Vibrio sp. MMH1-50]
MSILVDFNNVPQRLLDFEARSYDERYNQSPLIRGLAYTLIALEWEGTPSILSDAFIPKPKDSDSFIATIERLGYRCDVTKLKTLEHIEGHPHPCFIEIENLTAIFLGTKDGKLILFDYTNNNTIEYPLCKKPCLLVSISEYSRLFREPPPESQDRSNWIKYAFYRYNNELKSLIILSFVISILGALQPFFIMSVYNFALTSSSQATLYWLTLFAVIVGFSEYFFKKMRVNIIATSGKDLAVHISQAVISKLLWLPYAMTSTAGVSSQLARLKDIDTFRRLVTAESTLSYFDMPFVIVFIVAIAIMSGTAALVVMAGLILMLVFCVYSRYIYSQATSKSSRANAMVSYQWNEILRGIKTIQGLPLLRVIQSRFSASHMQSTNDAENVAVTNSKVQAAGGSLIQVIGTASIVTAVIGVMDGTSDAGAMLATVILVWKALGPIMGIYNSISKFQSIKASSAQINNLMAMNDDKLTLEKSPPIRLFQGSIVGSGVSHRYTGAATGLTNLGFKIAPGAKVVICGPTGCGKTTLISILAGLEDRYQGAVSVDGYNIKQFNSYRYRTSINYIPFNLHIFEGSLETNFILHNGLIPAEKMQEMVSFFELDAWLPEGLDTQLSVDKCKNLPNGIQQKLRLALGLGSCEQSLIIIDEPFNGAEQENAQYFNRLFTDKLLNKTVVFSTNDPGLIATSNMSLVLEPDGNLKYFGLTDKYLNSLS